MHVTSRTPATTPDCLRLTPDCLTDPPDCLRYHRFRPVTDSTATYLYCVVHAAVAPKPSRAPKGLPGATRPSVLPAGRSLWIVVASVPLERYGPAPLEASLRDMQWVADVAVAHEAVVEHFARQARTTVIPMKLFTMFSTTERAVEDMRSRRRDLDPGPEADCRLRGMGRADHQGGSGRDPPQGRCGTGVVGCGVSLGEETGARRRAGGRAGGGRAGRRRVRGARGRRPRCAPPRRSSRGCGPAAARRGRSWCPRAAARASNR